MEGQMPHAIHLQETHTRLQESPFTEYELRDELQSSRQAGQKGGLVTLVRKDARVIASRKSTYHTIAAIQREGRKGTLITASIYIPPANSAYCRDKYSDILEEVAEEIYAVSMETNTATPEILIAGDFNAHIANLDCGRPAEQLQKAERELGIPGTLAKRYTRCKGKPNSRGSAVDRWCDAHKLAVANGRVGGDY